MKYAFLNFIRDKVTLFWMILFPLFLMTILISAMPDEDTKLEIKAYMSPENVAANYMEDTGIFKFTLSNDYKEPLKNGDIAGYIDKDSNVILAGNGFSASLLKSFADNILRAQKDPQALQVAMQTNPIENKSKNVSYKASFFFALMAMISYMCAYSGVSSVELYQANITKPAMRFLISPSSKLKAIVNEFIIAMIMQALVLTISIFYAKYVLGEDFISNYKMTYLIFMVGSIFSYSLGLMTVYLGNISSNARGAIVQTTMMILSGAAGLYGIYFRQVLNKVFGIFADYNPVKMVGDGIYQANTLGSVEGIKSQVFIILGISLAFILLAALKMKENRYDSI